MSNPKGHMPGRGQDFCDDIKLQDKGGNGVKTYLSKCDVIYGLPQWKEQI